nr:MAK10-like protein [Tanacetum cinerariifolium]
MGSKEEAERFKRKGIRFKQESVKKLKTSKEVPKEVKTPDEVLKKKTYSNKSLIMASIFVSKSKPFMTMSIPQQGEPSISRLVVISLPQDIPSTFDRHLIELENQVQRLMKAHLAPNLPNQANKIASSCEICSGPCDTQYCMENHEQAFAKYASSCTDEVGGKDAELCPFKDVLVFRKMVKFLRTIPINLKGNMWESKELIENRLNWNRPPKEDDRAWHAKIRLIDPDGEKFTKIFQSILTTRKFSKKESPREIIDLDHFHDS